MGDIFKVTDDGKFVFDKELFEFYLKRGINPVVNIVDIMNLLGHIDDAVNKVFAEHIQEIIKSE